MKIIDKIQVENFYCGSNWDFERTTKYIFQIDDIKVEAGYFEHYKEDELIKAVIELPQSYGCPTKCCFCASATIDNFKLLDADTLEEMFWYIYEENKLLTQQYVLLTMTGMGDLYFNYQNLEIFLLRIKEIPNLYVTLSSCLWTVELLKKVQKLSAYIKIRNIQITFVTDEYERLIQIIPFYKSKMYELQEVINYVEQSEERFYRINYIMIKNINDSEEEFYHFANLIKRISEKVIVRISKLNETKTTKINQLQPTEISQLEKMKGILLEEGINSYVFYAYKNDNMNCGQLITER